MADKDKEGVAEEAKASSSQQGPTLQGLTAQEALEARDFMLCVEHSHWQQEKERLVSTVSIYIVSPKHHTLCSFYHQRFKLTSV